MIRVASLCLLLALASCSANQHGGGKHGLLDQEEMKYVDPPILDDTVYVKSWLAGVIEKYTNSKDPVTAHTTLRQSLTDSYYNYKHDALSLMYDNGDTSFTEEMFRKKWAGKYKPEFAGNAGFFISSQDNGRIKVSRCFLRKKESDSTAYYNLFIDDLDFKLRYEREVKIVARENKLLIDDVIEYESEPGNIQK